MNRRSLLALMGSSLITRRLSGDPNAPMEAPKRLVIVMQNNGTQQGSFWPNENFTSPILEPILSVPRLAARTTVVKGIEVPRELNGTDAQSAASSEQTDGQSPQDTRT